MTNDQLYPANMGLSPRVVDYVNQIESKMAPSMEVPDCVAEYNQLKVLHAMQENRISEAHFAATTGYGYNDLGRSALEAVYAAIFKAESALVRPQMVSGTHALATALFGNLRPGDTLLSVTGAPYDTLQAVIGIRPTSGSLSEYGIEYRQVDLTAEGGFDYDGIRSALLDFHLNVKMVAIQRSKGYAWRPSFSINQLSELISFIKNINPNVLCMVDNCYGEFVEYKEPIEIGADLAVGSLIKNPGGGLAPAGGYIVGAKSYVEKAANWLTAPGLGMEVGPTLGVTATLMQGLFMAPQVVASSVRGAVLAGAVFKKLGFSVLPDPMDVRTDIVQAIKIGSAEGVLAFCKGIQKASPVDSFVTPEGAPMPGYDHRVIMAAGAFIQGSSIELSADAPLIPPFTVYMQGGLTRHHAKIGVISAMQELTNAGIIQNQ